MFGAGFYPLITKPSHITDSSATLIDNILIYDLTKINKEKNLNKKHLTKLGD